MEEFDRGAVFEHHPGPAVEFVLDREGVLPRYAFPTDVVAFHVFGRARSTRFRPLFEYAPSQGLPAALTQYAPGREVWVDGKLWTSGALYSPMHVGEFNQIGARRPLVVAVLRTIRQTGPPKSGAITK